MSRPTDAHVIGAVRLALTGAGDPGSALELVRALVDQAPATVGADTEPVDLLLRTLRKRGGRIEVRTA